MLEQHSNSQACTGIGKVKICNAPVQRFNKIFFKQF